MAHLIAIDVGLTALGWAAWSLAGSLPTRRCGDNKHPIKPDSCGIITVPGKVTKANRTDDPKKNRVAWINNAAWIHGRFEETVLTKFKPLVIAVEWPEFRSGSALGLAAAGGAALTKLAMCAGAHAQQAWDRGADAVLVPVSTWKGMLKKDVTNMRVVRAIGDKAVDGTAFHSHAWDAVGIGLHVLGFPMDHPCFSRSRM